jgi:hypothetical protein
MFTASDTHRVTSDLTYSVGQSDNGHVLTCKAVNVAASSGLQVTKTLDVKYKLNTVLATNKRNVISELVSVLFWYCTYNYSITVMEVCRPLETATLTALHVNICPLSLFPTLYIKSDITVYVSLAV